MGRVRGAAHVMGEGLRRARARPIFCLTGKGGCAMQATANQVRWVPVDEIVVPEGLEDDAPEGSELHISVDEHPEDPDHHG